MQTGETRLTDHQNSSLRSWRALASKIGCVLLLARLAGKRKLPGYGHSVEASVA